MVPSVYRLAYLSRSSTAMSDGVQASSAWMVKYGTQKPAARMALLASCSAASTFWSLQETGSKNKGARA